MSLSRRTNARLVDTISDLLIRLDSKGKIVKRPRKVYPMMLFGMLNFSRTLLE
ncbi:hypothetical protein [Bradyrhizobium sp.]|uniref:hypothetical protein n=1 Tax=Bradyrhizobium sp. TaxID=376 RepID=UPI004037E9C9